MTTETINNRILIIGRAIEESQDNNELARLDNELEQLELLKIEMEIEENAD